LLNLRNYAILEIFQKLPSGPSKPPGDSLLFCAILGFLRGTTRRHELGRQATRVVQPSFWVFGWST